MSEVAVSIPVSETDTAKRQQILDGARRCFLAQGFDGASMNDIVTAAGVSKGTVYAYFPSKEKLFATMVFEDKRRHAERTVVSANEARPVDEVRLKWRSAWSASSRRRNRWPIQDGDRRFG